MLAVNLFQCWLTQTHLNHRLVINIKKWSAIKMQVSAEDDCHPKQKGRCDLQLTFININNYRKEVNTCDVLCVIFRTHLQCSSSMLVRESPKLPIVARGQYPQSLWCHHSIWPMQLSRKLLHFTHWSFCWERKILFKVLQCVYICHILYEDYFANSQLPK